MSQKRVFKIIADKLKEHHVRPTSQRMNIARLMFGDDLSLHRHFTADQIYAESKENGLRLSLATIYNNLNIFKEAGLLREVILNSGNSYFDTNLSDHHHFFDESNGQVIDIDVEKLKLLDLPKAPEGKKIDSVQIVIRLKDSHTA